MIKKEKQKIKSGIIAVYNSPLKIRNRITGITLISLIITVIVLLILSGVAIGILTGKNELLNQTTAAKEETRADEVKKERDIWFAQIQSDDYFGGGIRTLDQVLTQLLNQGILTENEINTINTNENKEIKIGSKVISFNIENINHEESIASILKVGDYVAYSPDPVTVTGQTQIIKDLQTYSGHTGTDANTENQITQENLNWRVLDIVNGQVILISDTPTTFKVYLKGANGYNNGVKLLDDLCNSLYSKTGVGVARNLKMEDIQETMKVTDYSTIDSNYGATFTPDDKRYPNIFANENGQLGNNKNGKLGLSEQDRWYTGESTATVLNTTYTYWGKIMGAGDFKDYSNTTNKSMYYTLFMNNGTDYSNYWLSSRSVRASSNYNIYYLRSVYSSSPNGNVLYDSTGNSVRPIVFLSPNIQIDKTDLSKDGSTKELAWVLK